MQLTKQASVFTSVILLSNPKGMIWLIEKASDKYKLTTYSQSYDFVN